jgi:hypothetical protein
MNKIVWLALIVVSLRAESIEAFGLKWRVQTAADWKYEKGVLGLLTPRPSEKPRRPIQYALAETPHYLKVTIDAEVKKEPTATRNRRTSVMFVYAWRDADHFNYAHLSVDTAAQAAHHNGVFHVYGGDRVRISSTEGPATLPTEEWHRVRLIYNGEAGRVEIYVDGKTSPSMQAVDLSLREGKVGIGSFFDMGSFRNVKIEGVTR